MARRTFDVVDIIEILVHWHAGRSNSEIAQSLDVDRKTARKNIAAAEAAGMRPGGPAVTEERWAELVREWFPELADTRLRQVTWPAIEAHHEYIREQLEAGVTVTTVHQRLRDERGLAVSIASFRRYVTANLLEETCRSQVKALRPYLAEPGAEAQIDYGWLGRWLDPVTWKVAHYLGVRDGAGVLAAHVRAAGDPAGPAGLERVLRRGVRVLRRGAGPAGAGQPQDRGGPPGPV